MKPSPPHASPADDPMRHLLEIMRRLRDPEGGCPWDRQQDFRSLVPYTLEEAYEVADAIERGAFDELCGELGDLLFQVVFHAQLAAEQGRFGFEDVARSIADKLVRRHPHVFADARVADAEQQTLDWERRKAAEREARSGGRAGVLHDIPQALPALTRAAKLQRRLARAVPEADRPQQPLLEASLDALRRALGEGGGPAAGAALGELLFHAAGLARQQGLDPEHLLREANRDFEQRVEGLEARLAAEGRRLEDAGADALAALWVRDGDGAA
ncbi:nucleoside triphosphate pyrophosphohydrolase [Thiohalobacter sp. IOR34]|uniref:nucleoside triphosphate pyrophosphohydrolase n=1 Tax=Thiohalobacter sp. IOR34 TaxID=3057176 RepID=UPI0025B05414|nr:nucleoside triphosphate pyrophosphohydrolase [Thiohalobacter sp. IOR34]WJW75111.1 nucleoside triphosphate pyrophosphohydrolase [Thiohalobacter sp. IOR34]